MSFLSAISDEFVAKPRKTVIHGLSGLGKTTWAAAHPNAVIVQTEDGCRDIQVHSTPVCTRFDTVTGVLNELASPGTDHDFETVVLDSADWCQTLIAKSLYDEGFPTDYGKGAIEEARRFKMVLDALSGCAARGMNVIVIAHSEMKRFEDPHGNSYDRMQPKLPKRSNDLLVEWADEVGYCMQRLFTVEKKEKFGTRNIAKSTGEIDLCFAPNPAYVSKKRLRGLPDKVDLWSFEEYAIHNPFLQGREPEERTV